MAKGKGNDNNSANQQNANKGTSGTNRQYDQNQGNRGKQLNPNQKKIVHYSNKKRLSIAIDNLFLLSKKSNLSCLIKKIKTNVFKLF